MQGLRVLGCCGPIGYRSGVYYKMCIGTRKGHRMKGDGN